MTSSADISAASRYFRAESGVLLPETASVGRGVRRSRSRSERCRVWLHFHGPIKIHRRRAEFCGIPSPPTLPQWTHRRTLLFRVGVFSGKECFSTPSGKRSYLREGRGRGGDGVLRPVSVALTQEVLSAGPHSCCLEKKTLSHTHSFVFLASPPSSGFHL